MTIKTVDFTNIQTLFQNLEELALLNKDILFRGHSDSSFKVSSTLSRHTSIPMSADVGDLEDNLKYFMYKMQSLGNVPFVKMTRRAVLEYARHYGIPTPVIDFTWSPYVAAYFAFGRIKWKHGSDPRYASIIALDLSSLAIGWRKIFGLGHEAYEEFMYEKPDFFAAGYPTDVLKYLWFPASWNKRMHAQQGSFIYDAIDYRTTGRFADFEDLVAAIDEPTDATTDQKEPTMTKFLIPHSAVGDVLARLELTNINGINLLDYEGVASDVMNTYNHNRKTGYTWDIDFE